MALKPLELTKGFEKASERLSNRRAEGNPDGDVLAQLQRTFERATNGRKPGLPGDWTTDREEDKD